MANRSAWTQGAGWGRTGEAPMGLLPSPPLSLLPCSREAWGLLGGEGQLVVITHRLRRRWARLGAFWDRERLGDSVRMLCGGPRGKQAFCGKEEGSESPPREVTSDPQVSKV